MHTSSINTQVNHNDLNIIIGNGHKKEIFSNYLVPFWLQSQYAWHSPIPLQQNIQESRGMEYHRIVIGGEGGHL